MSNGLIAFFFAIGASAWVYSKFNKKTGGNTQTAVVGAATVGILVFIVAITILGLLPESQ